MSQQSSAFTLDQSMNIFLECSSGDIFVDDFITL